MQNKDPVIIVGPPRSGTSAVARVLHEQMGVCMGLNFVKPNKHNSNGFYEDADFIYANQDFLLGKINFCEWWDATSSFFNKMMSLGKAWGFKDSRINYLFGLFIINFEDPLIIRCHIDLDTTVKSMQGCLSLTTKEAVSIYNNMNICLDRILKNREYINIDLNKHLSDEQIQQTILTFIEKEM